MAQDQDLDQIRSKSKAITAFFPYAVLQEQNGEWRMIDAFFSVARASKLTKFMWRAVKPYTSTLFSKASPQTIVLVSPHISQHGGLLKKDEVTMWAAAAWVVPITEEVGQSVVDTLLYLAYFDDLQPYIPINIWAWLKKQPSLPPGCMGQLWGSKGDVVCRVQALGDIEILKSYLLIVWSEWDSISVSGLIEMCTVIEEDFSGIGMGYHREDLINHLDYILGQLDQGQGYPPQYYQNAQELDIQLAKDHYGELKKLLLKVDKEAMEILTRMSF